MNIETVDRIVITSYERIEIIIRWYLDNQDALSEMEFIAPLKKGYVELQTEGWNFTFESKGKIVHIDAYESDHNNKIFGFDYNPITLQTNNLIYYIPKNQIPLWRGFINGDKSLYKLSIKYHALMMFMAHYREYVTKKDAKVKSSAATGKKRSTTAHSNSLITKVYTLDGFKKSDIKNLDGKRKYTVPDHAVEYRGFERHLKSGKVIWVNGFTKYKDKGPKQPKNYKW